MRRRVLATLVFGYLVLASGLAAEPDGALPDAPALRARMAAAEGPVNSNYRETIVSGGYDGASVATHYHRGTDDRVSLEQGPIHTGYGTLHEADWHQNANGIVVRDVRDPDPAASGSTESSVARVRTPLDAYVLTELDGSGYGTRDYVDPVSYLVLRHDEIGSAGTATTINTSFARFGSQMLPATWRLEDGAFDEATSYARTRFVAGSTSVADVAEPPRRQIVSLPNGAATIDLHARFDGDRITVPVAIGGRTFFFLLDSGASAITIDATVAKRLGLTLVNARHEIASRRYEAHDAILPAMDVAGLRMQDVVVSVLPLTDGETSADPVGLLGFDFLAQLAVRIDYQHKRVLAMDARAYRPPVGTDVSALDVRLGSQVPMVSANVAGALSGRLIVDTGSPSALLLFDYFSRHHGDVLRAVSNAADDPALGIGGAFSSSPFRMPYVRIGRFSLADLVADIVTSRGAYPQDDDGLIGAGLLQHFTVDFDYTGGQIFLRARPELTNVVS